VDHDFLSRLWRASYATTQSCYFSFDKTVDKVNLSVYYSMAACHRTSTSELKVCVLGESASEFLENTIANQLSSLCAQSLPYGVMILLPLVQHYLYKSRSEGLRIFLRELVGDLLIRIVARHD